MPSRPLVVPATLLDRARFQEGLVSTGQCHAAGLTDQQVQRLHRTGRWQRVVRGVHDTRTDGSPGLDLHDRRRRRAAVLGVLACPGSVAVGVAALVLHGVRGAPQVVVPEAALPDGSSRRGSGQVVVRRWSFDDHVEIDGLPVVRVEDALVQAVGTVGRRHAVALMDSARRQRLITPEEFARAAERDRRRRGGVGRTGWWWSSDSRAESPAETWARLSCTDRGFPPDSLQLLVDSPSGRQVARVDLAWILPGAGVLLVEVDGIDVHSLPGAVPRDRTRQNRLVGRGVTLLRFTGRDAWNGTVAAQVAAFLTAARWSRRELPSGYRYRLDRAPAQASAP